MAADTDPKLFVVDSSVILSSILPDEIVPKELNLIIKKFTKNQVLFFAPTILAFEVGNALKSSVKQNRLDQSKALGIYEFFLSIPVRYITTNHQKTLDLSLKHNISFYDASYLSLAQEKKAKLLTLDQKLLACLPK